MNAPRITVFLLCTVFGLVGSVLAEEAAKEAKPADADVGEASYNVADCESAEAEGVENEKDDDSDGEGDINDCEDVVK